MTRIADLGKQNANLPDMIMAYVDELDLAGDRLKIKGKSLEVAQQEQCAWPIFYEVRKAELKILVKHFNAEVSRVRGNLSRRFNENYSRQLGERMINSYIDAEDEYLKMNQLLLEVDELYEQYGAVCDAFTKRGFALRDLTTAKVNQLHTLPI